MCWQKHLMSMPAFPYICNKTYNPRVSVKKKCNPHTSVTKHVIPMCNFLNLPILATKIKKKVKCVLVSN